MSYHNGSVWPHDNALIAQGLARYGMRGASLKVLAGLFDASIFADANRLPELFCGFQRRTGEGPTLYPVACAPQAWAAGAVFLLLAACLGISIQAHPPQIVVRRALLPEFLQCVELRRIRVGDAAVDLVARRAGESVTVAVLEKSGDVEIVSVK
jgi:glycogen debranching enzyme